MLRVWFLTNNSDILNTSLGVGQRKVPCQLDTSNTTIKLFLKTLGWTNKTLILDSSGESLAPDSLLPSTSISSPLYFFDEKHRESGRLVQMVLIKSLMNFAKVLEEGLIDAHFKEMEEKTSFSDLTLEIIREPNVIEQGIKYRLEASVKCAGIVQVIVNDRVIKVMNLIDGCTEPFSLQFGPGLHSIIAWLAGNAGSFSVWSNTIHELV